jgi:putative flippase GtrA
MPEILARLRTSRLFRYLFIGGVSYIIELSTLLFLARIFSPSIAVACSFWVGLVVSFVLQKSVAFGNKTTTKKAFGKQATLYGLLVLFNYIFTIIFVSTFTGHLGLAIARTLALLLTVSWNYLAYKEIFKQ